MHRQKSRQSGLYSHSEVDEKENNEDITSEDENEAAHRSPPASQTMKDPLTPRRSLRKPTPSLKYILSASQGTMSKRQSTDRVPTEESSSNDEEYEAHEKPTALFDAERDVAGQNMFSFRSPRKRNGMALLAANTPKTPKISSELQALTLNSPEPMTPKRRGRRSLAETRTPRSQAQNHHGNTPKTPKVSSALQALTLNSPSIRNLNLALAETLKTPHSIRSRHQKVTRKTIRELNESGSDFSADEDTDYKASDSDDSSEDSASSNHSEESDDDDFDVRKVTINKKNSSIIKMAKVNVRSAVQMDPKPSISRQTRMQQRLQQNKDFLPQSENYFSSQAMKKIKTSNHTMDRLKSSRLHHDDLFSILKSIEISEEHSSKTRDLIQEYQYSFSKWMTVFRKGYNVVLFGLGSKQCVIQQFCEQYLSQRPLMIVNGFFPTLTVKDILHSIKTDILNLKSTSRNDHEVVDAICDAFKSSPNTHFFLIIHNLDGPMLRKTKDQHILSRLAKVKNIHLLCSIDHINAPMMWDQTCMSNYNFLWWDCTTMLPYTKETAFENSAFMQNSGELGLAAMNNVFQSLTTNARGIYMLLAKAQLKNKVDSNYQGMSFRDLYHGCREGFLVNSDLALRTQLTEFVDHNMVRIKRTQDGIEHLIIPIEQNILEQFAEQHENY